MVLPQVMSSPAEIEQRASTETFLNLFSFLSLSSPSPSQKQKQSTREMTESNSSSISNGGGVDQLDSAGSNAMDADDQLPDVVAAAAAAMLVVYFLMNHCLSYIL